MSRAIYYIVIQWVPDWGRAESVNFGLMFYDAKTGEHWFKLNPSKARLERLWGSEAPGESHWRNVVEAIGSQLATQKFADSEDLRRFIGRHGNAVHFYQPRPMIINGEPQQELEDLYQKLVV